MDSESIHARVLADSISPVGIRLTTLEVTMPRIVLAEFNTHRMFSRNSASSRAIPVEKILKRVEDNPFTPVYWGRNQKGMQASAELDDISREMALRVWLQARDDAVNRVMELLKLGVHKQIANRLLEPWLYHVAIVTATEWSNFFHLRASADAQPEIRVVAEAMQDVMAKSEPDQLKEGQWHLPLIQDADFVDLGFDITGESGRVFAQISSARCARVSYLTHDGKLDRVADMGLHGKLTDGGHMSPLEHPAQAVADWNMYGNLRGWKSLRYQTTGESDILGYRSLAATGSL